MEILDRMSKWGYTLLELIVVLALFALFLSIAIPSVSMISRIREKNELKEFRRDIINARNMAVVENTSYSIVLNGKKNEYSIRKADDPNNYIKKVSFKHGIKISESQDFTSITFKNTGAPSGGGRTIYLSDSKKESIELTIVPATGIANFK